MGLISEIFKFRKAQHIVELALLAPFIIVFIGVAAEIAIVINSNYKFTSSLYEAINLLALTNKIETEKKDTADNIKEYTKALLTKRLVPYAQSFELKLVQTDDIDFLIGTYRYKSTFTIFNAVKDFTLDSYNFITVIPLNSAILRKNSYTIPDTFFDTPITVSSGSEEPQNPETGGETETGTDSTDKEEGTYEAGALEVEI